MSTHNAEIRTFVVEEFLPDVPAEDLADDDDLLANGIIDSLGLLQVIAWLEDRFGLVLDDAEIGPDSFRSVDTIAAFVEQARLEANAAP
jgi:acyl carrier protein